MVDHYFSYRGPLHQFYWLRPRRSNPPVPRLSVPSCLARQLGNDRTQPRLPRQVQRCSQRMDGLENEVVHVLLHRNVHLLLVPRLYPTSDVVLQLDHLDCPR